MNKSVYLVKNDSWKDVAVVKSSGAKQAFQKMLSANTMVVGIDYELSDDGKIGFKTIKKDELNLIDATMVYDLGIPGGRIDKQFIISDLDAIQFIETSGNPTESLAINILSTDGIDAAKGVTIAIVERIGKVDEAQFLVKVLSKEKIDSDALKNAFGFIGEDVTLNPAYYPENLVLREVEKPLSGVMQ